MKPTKENYRKPICLGDVVMPGPRTRTVLSAHLTEVGTFFAMGSGASQPTRPPAPETHELETTLLEGCQMGDESSIECLVQIYV